MFLIKTATKSCTRHNCYVVVACAKICCILIIRYWITGKLNFHQSWIVSDKFLIKWSILTWYIFSKIFTIDTSKHFELRHQCRHHENFWAFTGPRKDLVLVLLILNMIIHRSFTGPTHLLSANVRGPVNFAVSLSGLVQDCSNSIANALKLLQSCTKPSI